MGGQERERLARLCRVGQRTFGMSTGSVEIILRAMVGRSAELPLGATEAGVSQGQPAFVLRQPGSGQGQLARIKRQGSSQEHER
jgi:hypothetical protein